MRTGFRSVIKRASIALGVVVLAYVLWNWKLVSYGISQGIGQLRIIVQAQPVEKFMSDPAFPDSLKQKLVLIQQVRKFAIDSLGLKDTKNYKTLFDQKGKEIMWVVIASEPYALRAKEWSFPIIGSVPYKGFFNKSSALELKQELEQEGYDVIVRNPGGWSTLGWFTDPILSKMLNRSEGDLANLIIHEMSHATIFVKDSVKFNENLATFIGDRGAEQFLRSKYGEEGEPYKTYMAEDRDYTKFVGHMLRGAARLDSLYTNIQGQSEAMKRKEKEALIEAIVQSLDTLSLETSAYPSSRYKNNLPNNAFFLNFRQYQEQQPQFWEELNRKFDGNLPHYIAYLSEKYPFL